MAGYDDAANQFNSYHSYLDIVSLKSLSSLFTAPAGTPVRARPNLPTFG
jgi:hypothetical protein